MRRSKIQTLLLDLDGTLIDSRSDLAEAVNCGLISVGQKAQTQAQIVPHVGNGLRTLLTNVMGFPVEEPVLKTAIAAFSEYYEDHCVDKTTAYPGVEAVLRELHGGVKLGVVTNKPLHFSNKILDRLGLLNFFQVVVGGDSTPEKKPHPAPILKALGDLEMSPGSSLMLGDGPQDLLAARSAGVKSCAARYGYGFSEELLKLNPDFQINAFIEIKDLVS